MSIEYVHTTQVKCTRCLYVCIDHEEEADAGACGQAHLTTCVKATSTEHKLSVNNIARIFDFNEHHVCAENPNPDEQISRSMYEAIIKTRDEVLAENDRLKAEMRDLHSRVDALRQFVIPTNHIFDGHFSCPY